MRLHVLICAAALALATPAAAQYATPESVSISPEFQTTLDETLGAREGEILRAAVARAVNAELARRGANPNGVAIEITIVNADPNRPTFQQLSERPGLDPMRSISLGGAELRAVLRNASGQTIEEVSHRRYDRTLNELSGAESTWSSAHRSIRRFASKVADAYVAQSG
ncbi:MAG: hypothetical protein R3C25_11390 [Hyphomonadaceae bacterium]